MPVSVDPIKISYLRRHQPSSATRTMSKKKTRVAATEIEVQVMNRLESLFYEFRPYFLLALGIYVLGAQNPSPFAIACVLILMVCSALIIRFRLKARRGSSLEQLFYDLQPVMYFCLAGYALVWLHHSKLALACSLILLFCATMIVRWRLDRK